MRRVPGGLLPLFLLAACPALAQSNRVDGLASTGPTAQGPAPAAASTTLPAVQALRPDLEPVDPFAPRPNAMARRWRYDPSPEEITLRHNGYLYYYGIKGVVAAGRWLNTATGGPDQIQPAVAREVPLDDGQIARAGRWAMQER